MINQFQPFQQAQAPNIGAQFAELGQIIGQQRQAQAKQQQQEEAQRQYSIDIEGFAQNPNQQAMARLMLKYPSQREALKEAMSTVSAGQKENEFRSGFEISNALENGNLDVAKTLIQTQIEARKNSGQPTSTFDNLLKQIDENPVGAQANTNFYLAMLDPDRFEKFTKARVAGQTEGTEIVTKEAARDKALADAEEAEAKAKIAKANARNAQELAAAELQEKQAKAAKEAALSQQEGVKAKYAERKAVDELIKNAADLGLTKAQTNQAMALTNKYNFDIKKSALELKALQNSGGVPPEKTFEFEEKLRKEWQNRSSQYSTLGTTFSNLESSAKSANGPGDIALITGFMKMLDPGSVVRETEFATARDTAGLYTQLQNRLEKAQSGQLLSPAQRKQYVELAQKYFDSAKTKADKDRTDLGKVVSNYKLNPENVFGATGNAGRGTVNPEQRNVTVDY